MSFRFRAWWRTNFRWGLLLVLAFLVGYGLLAQERDAFAHWFHDQDLARARRIAFVLLVGVPTAQLVVGVLRYGAAKASGVTGIPGAQNAWPQRLVGTIETIGYALAFGYLDDPKDIVTGFGAWITLKNFGDWFRLKGDAPKLDRDESRRRLYVFLLTNVLNLGAGGALGWAIHNWAKADHQHHAIKASPATQAGPAPLSSQSSPSPAP